MIMWHQMMIMWQSHDVCTYIWFCLQCSSETIHSLVKLTRQVEQHSKTDLVYGGTGTWLIRTCLNSIPVPHTCISGSSTSGDDWAALRKSSQTLPCSALCSLHKQQHYVCCGCCLFVCLYVCLSSLRHNWRYVGTSRLSNSRLETGILRMIVKPIL